MINKLTALSDDEITQYSCLINEKNRTQKKDINDSFAFKVGYLFLENYRILDVLSENQFGFVYLVEKNDTSKTKYIIKEFFPEGCVLRGKRGQMLIKSGLNEDELASFNFMRKVFMDEAENLAYISQFKYSNIVHFVKLEENKNNTTYMIISYEEGMTFREYLERRREDKEQEISSTQIFKILNPLFDALENIHKLGIYHLNIKPENIWIKNDGSPLLIDFKASTVFLDEDSGKYCNAYTPRYASPEQFNPKSNSQIDQTSDIYAMGVLFYNLISNTFPVRADVRIKSIEIDKNKDPYTPSYMCNLLSKDDMPRSSLKAIDKALSFKKEDRHKNISHFRNALLASKKPSKMKLNSTNKIYFYAAGIMISLFTLYTYFSESIGNHKEELIETKVIDKPLENDKKKDIDLRKVSNTHLSKTKLPTLSTKKEITKVDQMQSNTNPVMKPEQNNTIEQTVQKNKTIVVQKKSISRPKSIEKANVRISIKLPIDIGETKIKVNGKDIRHKSLIVEEGKNYQFFIRNPYYKPISVKRTFDELQKFPEQTFVPLLGEGKLYLNGLPRHVQIKVYELHGKKTKELSPKISYKDGIYEMVLHSGKRFYMVFDKKGYKKYKTETLLLEHAKALTQFYSLKKENLNMEKDTSLITTPVIKKNKNIKKESIKKLKPVVKEVKKKIKKKQIKTKKDVTQKPKVKPQNKKQTKSLNKVSKKSLKNQASGLVWYCNAQAFGSGKASAKSSNKQRAEQMALQKCRKNNSGRTSCKIVSCFLSRG